MQTLTGTRKRLATEIRNAGWKIAGDAMSPLSQIDFAKLVAIHDHEERFLEEMFIRSLLALRESRASTRTDRGKVTAADVETALRMLGAAASRQSDETLSAKSRGIIKDSCGFCLARGR